MKVNFKDSLKRIKRALKPNKQTGKSVSIETTVEPVTSPSTKPVHPKTIVFAPLDSQGHINSLVSIANHLNLQGFRTVFLFIEPIENKLESLGHEVYDSTKVELVRSEPTSAAQDKWNEVIKACHIVWFGGDIMENFEQETTAGFGAMIVDIKKYNDNIAAKLELIKPDCIVVDHYFGIPSIFKHIESHNLPWIRVSSAAPLNLHSDSSLPPHYLGLPTNWDQSNAEYSKMVTRAREIRQKQFDDYSAYWDSFGLPQLPREPLSTIPVSPHLNLYMYPKELDYEQPLPNWTHCESILRCSSEPKPFELPEKLRQKPGKLIYLSLGSLASADVVLMKRLVDLLADCPHKFIVSKGPFSDQYELADNMWGEKFVDQLSVLSAVDLAIIHGGNNSIVESFFFGVGGLIVCPLFSGQFDNAVRVEESKLGVNLRPFFCTRQELHAAIERLLNDEEVRARMRAAGERMRLPEVRNKSLIEVDAMLKRNNLL